MVARFRAPLALEEPVAAIQGALAEFAIEVEGLQRRRRLLERALEDPAAIQIARSLTLELAAERLRGVLCFERESDAVLFLLMAAETHVVDLLENLANLGISGDPASGKTTAGRAFAFLGRQVEIAAAISAASIPYVAERSNAIVIDRIDRLLKTENGAMIAQLLDAGYERGLLYRKMMPVGDGKWVSVGVETYGVRFLTYQGSIESVHESTASRTVELRMPRVVEGAVRRRSRRLHRFLAPVALWMRKEGERVIGQYSPDDVAAIEDSAEFVALSDSLTRELENSTGPAPRVAQLAETLWLLGRLLGWNVKQAILEWVRDSVRNMPGRDGSTTRTSGAELKEWENATLEALRGYVLTEAKLELARMERSSCRRGGHGVCPASGCWDESGALGTPRTEVSRPPV